MFTVSNIYDQQTQETHFQTFIYVPGARPGAIIYCFDPSRNCNQQPGIYYPHAVDEIRDLIIYHNSSSNIKHESQRISVFYPEVTQACQIHDNDVFCQSWSLFLQISGIMTLLSTGKLDDNPIIPESQYEKYQILLNFYQQMLPIFCDALRKTYSSIGSIPSAYKSIDPCDIVANMRCQAIGDQVDCSLCGPPKPRTKTNCPEILRQRVLKQNSFETKQKHSRKLRVHSKPRSKSKKSPPKFSGSKSSKHHSSNQKKTQIKSPLTSTRLKPAGRGLIESRRRAKHKEMNKLLDSLDNMKLSSSAHKKIDKLDDILESLKELNVKSLAERRSAKLKSRRKKFNFDEEGIETIVNTLRNRYDENLAYCLERLYSRYRSNQSGRNPVQQESILQSLIKAIDEIIHHVDTGEPLGARASTVCQRLRPIESSSSDSDSGSDDSDSDSGSDDSDSDSGSDDSDSDSGSDDSDSDSGSDDSDSNSEPSQTQWQSGDTNLDDTVWEAPRSTSGEALGWDW